MRPTDVPAAESVTGLAFSAVPTSTPDRAPEAVIAWQSKASHLLRTDPDGCWVADDGDAVIGVAMSARRDLMWVLATYAVLPSHQRKGVGAALLDAAIGYGTGCLRGFICALPDPKALRRYRLAGFHLHPTMRLAGQVDRSAIPLIDGVRDGTDADRDLADSVDRRIRGAAHGPDHTELARNATLLVCDLFAGSGYAYVSGSSVTLLAATNRAVAQRLLWAALARMSPAAETTVRYLTSDQDWAIDVGLAAGLNIEQDGFLALRHMRPPSPYIPSPQFA